MLQSIKIFTFSGRMRSGKGVLANALKEKHGAVIISMADELKKLCCAVLSIETGDICTRDKLNELKNSETKFEHPITFSDFSIGYLSQRIDVPETDIKKLTVNFSFTTVRELLQKLGTDIIRTLKPDWHILRTLKHISELPPGTFVCVDDVRFKNELEAFRKNGARTFFVIRTNAETISNHESETSISWEDFNMSDIILNIGQEKQLVDEFISEYENSFDGVVDLPIFASDFPEYTNANITFGKEKNEVVEQLIEQNKDNETFIKEGRIVCRGNRNIKAVELVSEMKCDYERKNGRFVFDNPFIYENLKRYI